MKRLILIVVVGISVQAYARSSDVTSLVAFSQSIADIAEHVGSSIVQVRAAGTGSGVIVSDDGYIITNAHVLEGSKKVAVTLAQDVVSAKIIGVDSDADLALLKIEKKGLSYLDLDNYDVRQGQIVLAFGSPLGLANSMTMGIVSASHRIMGEDNPVDYVQTDAPINPGNSGGALVDTSGHLVGINTFILTQSGGNEGIGFAIPAGAVRNVYEQLRQNGEVRRGMIGAAAQALSDVFVEGLSLASHSGILVCDVAQDGPADRAGLKTGDIVLAANGAAMQIPRDLQSLVFNTLPGKSIKLDVLRGTSRSVMEMTVEQRPKLPEGIELSKLGLRAADTPQGVVITERPSESDGQAVDVRPGDGIVSLNNLPVKSVDDLHERLAAAASGSAVVLQVERNGGLRYVGVRLE